MDMGLTQILCGFIACVCIGNAFGREVSNFEKVACLTTAFVFTGLLILIAVLKVVVLSC